LGQRSSVSGGRSAALRRSQASAAWTHPHAQCASCCSAHAANILDGSFETASASPITCPHLLGEDMNTHIYFQIYSFELLCLFNIIFYSRFCHTRVKEYATDSSSPCDGHWFGTVQHPRRGAQKMIRRLDSPRWFAYVLACACFLGRQRRRSQCFSVHNSLSFVSFGSQVCFDGWPRRGWSQD